MSFDYSGLQSTAIRLIQRFGKDVEFSRASGATFDPVAGEYTGGTTVTVSGKCVQTKFDKSEIDGTLIKATDIKLLFEPDQGEPLINDTCTLNGVENRVVDVMPLSPADTVMLYAVQLRV